MNVESAECDVGRKVWDSATNVPMTQHFPAPISRPIETLSEQRKTAKQRTTHTLNMKCNDTMKLLIRSVNKKIKNDLVLKISFWCFEIHIILLGLIIPISLTLLKGTVHRHDCAGFILSLMGIRLLGICQCSNVTSILNTQQSHLLSASIVRSTEKKSYTYRFP